MINISGKDVKLWFGEFEGRNGKYRKYQIGISTKNLEGRYVHQYQKVRLKKDIDDRNFTNGMTIEFEGFPTLEVYTDREGNEHKDIVWQLTKVWEAGNGKGRVEDSFVEAEEDIPF